MANGERGAARIYLDELLRIHPHHPAALTNLSIQYERESQFDKAEALLLECSNHHPQFWPAFHRLGHVYFKRKEFLKALPCFERVVCVSPQENHRFNLAATYLALNRKEEARTIFKTLETIHVPEGLK